MTITRRFVLASGVGLCFGGSAKSVHRMSVPNLVFLSNMLADYIHLLFYRVPNERFPTFAPQGFAQVPQLDQLIAVPETIASAGLTRYDQLHAFIATTFAALPARRISSPHPRILSYSDNPPSLDEIQKLVAAGAPYFKDFVPYWKQYVGPQVREQIAVWKQQDEEFHPLRMLIAFQRLPLRADRLQVVAMPFHPAGSGNYSPAAVYSSLSKKPDLCWFLGHEASHLIWSEAHGTPLTSEPDAARLVDLATTQSVDIEETMCLFMQVQISKACGLSRPAYKMSARLKEGPQKRLMLALENDWDAYLSEPQHWPNLQLYVLDKARTVFA